MLVSVLGSLNVDFVNHVDRVPNEGETINGESFEIHNGGKGSNQAIAVSRTSELNLVETSMIGCVGNDYFGSKLIENLKTNKINTDNITISDLKNVKTGIANILVEKSGENRIIITSGANRLVSFDNIQQDKNILLFKNSSFLILQNEIPLKTVYNAIKISSKINPDLKIVYNPSPVYKIPNDIYPLISYLIVNEHEASTLSEINIDNNDLNSAYNSANKLLSFGTNNVIITLGSRGVIYASKQNDNNIKSGFVPAIKVKSVVDTTGAGDTFLGAFVAHLCKTSDLLDSILYANSAASIAVQSQGAAESIPTRDQVLQVYNSIKSD